MNEPTVFISYSHKDEKWKDRLKPHLIMLEKANIKITIWDDRKIDVGDKWYPEIENAMREASFAICLISPDYLASNFCVKEEVPFLLERSEKQGMVILPILIRPCYWELHPWISETQMLPRDGKSVAEDYDTKWDGIFLQIPKKIFKIINTPDYKKPVVTPKWGPPEKEDIGRLPKTEYELFGRQKELKLLDEAWESQQTNIISFVAWGGVGKSTLVNKWVERMAAENYRGAKKVFGWSFYSQGMGERVTSADLFIKEALTWFGDDNPEQGSPWDKGKRLANLVRQDKTLLILDGLEPLQSYLDVEKGKIKDPALGVLVAELAKNNNGLCLITTREQVPELGRYANTAQTINLEQISNEAGRALLRVRGVRGTDAELEEVTRAFGKHALAINLLAEFLHLMQGHPAKEALKIPDLKKVPVKKGKHPRRVIEAFAKHFGGGAEMELLHILGLFDRPADKAAIDAVIQGDPIPELIKDLHQISEREWLKLLQKLRDIKLIAPESHHRPDTLDCHPLIREHFGEKLRTDYPKAWKDANNRLYEYFKNLPEKELPDTLEEMEPLFMAVAHGCRAERYQETLYDIFWERIRRKDEQFSYHKLGAFGSDTLALSNFFEKPWSKVVSGLKDPYKAVSLNWAGFALRALGRLREAAQPMQAALEMHIEQKNWKESAKDAGNLSELYLTLGIVAQAVAFGNHSVEFADKSGDKFQRLYQRTTIADALHQQGYLLDSNNIFIKAENIEKERGGHNYLYSLQGFRFCDLLLSQGQVEEVLKRANETIKIAIENHWLLDIALDHLSLGRAYLLQASTSPSIPLQMGKIMEQATDYLHQAVDGLRKAGYQYYIPFGLFTRAELYRVQGDYRRAWDDLEEAHEIAERGEMGLYLADYHLGAGQLINWQLSIDNYQLLIDGRWVLTNKDEMVARLKDHLGTAKKMVNETGCHRRDPEVELGYTGLYLSDGDKENARVHLKKAKKLLEKMGIRMWDWEVEGLEKKL